MRASSQIKERSRLGQVMGVDLSGQNIEMKDLTWHNDLKRLSTFISNSLFGLKEEKRKEEE